MEIRPPLRYIEPDFVTALNVQNLLDNEPTSYEEAIEGKNANSWLAAMEDEMQSLAKSKTWILVNKRKGEMIIDCKWIHKIKESDSNDGNVRFNAILVAKRFNQRE